MGTVASGAGIEIVDAAIPCMESSLPGRPSSRPMPPGGLQLHDKMTKAADILSHGVRHPSRRRGGSWRDPEDGSAARRPPFRRPGVFGAEQRNSRHANCITDEGRPG